MSMRADELRVAKLEELYRGLKQWVGSTKPGDEQFWGDWGVVERTMKELEALDTPIPTPPTPSSRTLHPAINLDGPIAAAARYFANLRHLPDTSLKRAIEECDVLLDYYEHDPTYNTYPIRPFFAIHAVRYMRRLLRNRLMYLMAGHALDGKTTVVGGDKPPRVWEGKTGA